MAASQRFSLHCRVPSLRASVSPTRWIRRSPLPARSSAVAALPELRPQRQRCPRHRRDIMRIHAVDQGSAEWLKLRLGIPTASMFHKILTPKTQRISTQARGYAFRLVAEQILNESFSDLDYLEHVARGKELEPQAVQMFEFEQELSTEPVGFITTDDLRLGATPDRLIIGEAAALEVKCPAPWTHLEYLVDGFGADYMCQVQGQAYVGEFEYVCRYSFHPAMPPKLVKTPRDEAFIGNLRTALDEFCDMKDAIMEEVRAKGYFEDRKRLQTVADEIARQELRE